MKIAITSKGQDLDAEVDPRFGRAAYLIVVDSDTMAFEVLDNSQNVNALKGAGIQAARAISEKKAAVLLTGYCGPNAFQALKAGNIQVASDASGTIREAVAAYLRGDLPISDGPTAEGHW